MLALVLTAAAIVNPTQSHLEDMRCAGGAVIVFRQGSDILTQVASERLRSFANASLAAGIGSSANPQVESGGDELEEGFDRNLSFRRSRAILTFLAGHGYRADQIMVRVRRRGAAERDSEHSDDEGLRVGQVVQLLPNEVYARHFPGRNLECF